eukprot:Nk52_evm22s1400 gene=Nk52_evmTU22s1400
MSTASSGSRVKKPSLTKEALQGMLHSTKKPKKKINFQAIQSHADDGDSFSEHESVAGASDEPERSFGSRSMSDEEVEKASSAGGQESGAKVYREKSKKQYSSLTDGLKREQAEIEDNLRKAQAIVHFQDEEAHIQQSNLREAHNQYTLQLHQRRQLVERQERQAEHRRKREEFLAAQRIASKEEHIRQLKLQHMDEVLDYINERKLLIKQKREAFGERMKHIEERQQRERKELAMAQERTARNLKMILSLEIQHLKPVLRKRAINEHNLKQQQKIVTERKKAEQLRELQLIELKHKEKEFSHEITAIELMDDLCIQQKTNTLELNNNHSLAYLKDETALHMAEFELTELITKKRQEKKLEDQAKKQRIEAAKLKKQHEQKAVARQKAMESNANDDKTVQASNMSEGSAFSDGMSSGNGDDDEDMRDEVIRKALEEDNEETVVKDLSNMTEEEKKAHEIEEAVRLQTAEARQKVIDMRLNLQKMKSEQRDEAKEFKIVMRQKMLELREDIRRRQQEIHQQNEQELRGVRTEQAEDMCRIDESNQRELKTHLEMAQADMRSYLEQQKLDAVLNTVADGIIAISTTGVISTVNSACVEMFGYTEQEMVGNNITMLMPERFGVNHHTYLNNYLTTGVKKVIGIGRTVPGRKKNGEEFDLELAISEVKNDDAHLFTGILRDVTERNRTERMIQLERTKLAAILATCTDGIVVIDTVGTIERVNETVVTLFGYSKEELIGENVTKLMPEEHAMNHHTYLNNYLTTGNAKVIGKGRNLNAKAKDGELITVDLSVAEIKEGDVHLFVGLMRDCREELAEKERLRAEQEKLQSVLDLVPEGVISITETGDILSANKMTRELFHYSEKEMIGNNVTMLMPEQFRMHHAGYLMKYLQTGEKKVIGIGRSVEGMKKDGTLFPIHLDVSEIITSKGERVFTGCIRDLTESKKQQAKSDYEEKRNQIVMDTINGGCIQIDKTGVISHVNEGAAKLLGYASVEMIGNNVTMIMPPQHARNHHTYLSSYLTTGIKKVIDTEGRRLAGVKKDGSQIDLHLRVNEIVDENGEKQFVGILEDVSYLRQIEESRELELQRRDNLLSGVPDAAFVASTSGIIEYANPAAYKIFGYTSGDLVGKDIKILMPQQMKNMHDSYVQNYLDSGIAKVINGEPRKVRGVRKNNSIVHLLLSITELDKGTPSHKFIAYMKDLTEMQYLEDMVKQQNGRR